MNCICCGRPLKTEDPSQWHKSCVHRFFGTERIPETGLGDNTPEALAAEAAGEGFTVPGVQKKLPLRLLSEGGGTRLTPTGIPHEYILKPPSTEYAALPEAEHLVMSMADAAGIAAAPHALVRIRGGYFYITKRLDRPDASEMLAMEDFCQLDMRLTEDKYHSSYERCAKVIRRYSSRAGCDMAEFFTRLVFSFITGNSDMHLKNFSMIETAPGSGEFVLSPAYDLLPVNIILPGDPDETALTLNGKRRNLHRNDFLKFAKNCGISDAAAFKMIRSMTDKCPSFVSMAEESLLPRPMKESLIALMETRTATLSPAGDRE